MNVTCIQMNMALGQVDQNFAHAEFLVRQAMVPMAASVTANDGLAAKSTQEYAAEEALQATVWQRPDTIVLPETWNTGFFPKQRLRELCDKDGRRTKSVFGSLAKELNVNIIAGSVANLKADGIYNTCYVFNRQGNCIAEYDKTHLFSPMGEDKYFQKGNRLCRFELDGVKCAVIICYDVRFPDFCRSLTVHGVDIMFMVSQWPLPRLRHLQVLTRARAIENQMFFVCCNSVAVAENTVYAGNSAIISPWGDIISQASGTKEQIISAKCDINVVTGIRQSINVFADRRPELNDLS